MLAPDSLPRRLAALAVVAGVSACSFAWDDYLPGEPSSVSGSSSASAGGGGAGGCGKLCGQECVSIDDPAFGCTPTSCDPCSVASGTATCVAGACAVAACDAAHEDCNGLPDDGCECAGICNAGICSAEDCTNGLDDDADGDVDCGDADCSAYSCQDPPPDGWAGPIVFYEGGPSAVPSCGQALGAEVYLGFVDLVPEPASCSPCTCDAPVTCNLSPLVPYSTGACAVGQSSVTQPAPNVCKMVSVVSAAGYTAGTPTASAGACQPAGGQATVPPPNFMTAGLACAPPAYGGGCGKQLCAPTPVDPFSSSACIFSAGDQTCPAAFPTKHHFHDGVVDTRGCTSCGCTGAASPSCDATTEIFDNPNCNGGVDASIPNDGACHAGTPAKSIRVDLVSSGPCPAAGGDPTGTIVESPEVGTVCCAP